MRIDGIGWKGRFFTIWIGQACSMVGSALVRFALIWWLTERTESPTVLTMATLVSIAPTIFLAPFAGTFVDRWNRRWVMIISDTSIAVFTGVMAYLYWLDVAQVWHVYAVLFLRSFGDAFQWPAMRASTSLMVPDSELARVGGMNETLMGVINIISPPLGALMLELMAMQGTLAIDIVTAVAAIAPLLVLQIPQPDSDSGEVGKSILQDMARGFRYVWNWRGLFLMLVILAVLRFFMVPSFSLLPLMVKDWFGGGAFELAWMNSAHGAGFITGGIILSVWGGFERRTKTALLGFLGVGIGSIAFGLVPANGFWLAVLIMLVRTTMLPLIRGSVLAIFQSHVPPDIQGRVFTLLVSSISVMAPLGLAIGGPLAEAFGIRLLFVLAGLGCLLISVIWVLTPTITHMEDDSPERSREQAPRLSPSDLDQG